jgi:hypothetical protein
MPEGPGTYGKKRGRPPTKKMEMETAEIDGDKIEFKKGALHRQLKVKDDYTFKKGELGKLLKVDNGEMFEFKGKSFKMTPLLKRRINFALVLMKGSKK